MITPTQLDQIAREYAEQKVMTSSVQNVDPEVVHALWTANALEVLVFALPRIRALDEDAEATRLMSAAEIQAALT